MPGEDRPTPLWSFGAYAVDFIRIGAQWKIWHLHWMRTIKCRYDTGWVDDLSMAFGGPVPAREGVEPTRYHNPYTPTAVQDSIPPRPMPYDTWDGEGWAIREQVPGPRGAGDTD